MTSEELNHICQIVSQEKNQTVARLICDLVAIWVRQAQRVASGSIEALAGIPGQLLAQNLFDGGTARSMMDALKAIAQSEDKTLNVMQLKEAVRNLLTSIHLKQVRNSESEMIDLLSAMHRLDQHFLRILVDESCSVLAQKGWNQNISAILKTIKRVENQNSALLEVIQNSAWCTSEIRSIILGIMGS